MSIFKPWTKSDDARTLVHRYDLFDNESPVKQRFDMEQRAAFVPIRQRVGLLTLSTPMTAINNLAEMCWRLSTVFQDDALEVRLCIRNHSPLAEAAALFGAEFAAVYAGPQALDGAGTPTGAFAADPVLLFPAFTLPADGSEYVSGWVSPEGGLPRAGEPWLFSFAYTGGATSGGGQRAGSVNTWYRIGAGTAGSVNQPDATGFAAGNTAPFDVRIEVRYKTATSVGLAVGDSITFGAGGAAVPGQHAYPAVYGVRTRNHLVNAGIPSSTLAQWAGASTEGKWSRLAPVLDGLDFALVALGTNSLGTALATMQANFLTIVGTLRALVGADVPIYGGTIPPRNQPHSQLAAPAAVGATSLVLDDGDVPAGSARIGEGWSMEMATLSASPTGTGPYTYTVTALTKAHRAGEHVARGGETTRLDYNSWLRALPGGIAGVVDFDLALAADYDRGVLRPEFSQADQLHPTVPGLDRMAGVIPVLTPRA